MIFTAFSCKNTTGQSGLAPVLGVDNHPLTDEEGVRNEANKTRLRGSWLLINRMMLKRVHIVAMGL